MTGHAIEARVYAEDPARGFLPTGGTVLDARRGRKARVSGSIPGLTAGTVVGSDYDPMLAKVIAHADDRPAALRQLDRALADTAVLGVTTNIEFLRFLLADPDVAAGRLDTGLLDRRTPDFVAGAARRRRVDRRGRLPLAAVAGPPRPDDLWDDAVGLAGRRARADHDPAARR